MGNFRTLRVWQEAKELAVQIYKLTNAGDFSRDFGLRDQIRRAGVSVASNIAEGDELGTNKQAVRFFYISKGSAAEVITQAIIAFEIGYVNKENQDYIVDKTEKISSMLNKLIVARSR
jgi:four helix bundle protein